MRSFQEYITTQIGIIEEFEAFLAENNTELYENWRGMLGGLVRGLGRGVLKTGQELGGGLAQTAGGLLGAGGAALRGRGQEALSNLRQAGGGAAASVFSPVPGLIRGAQAYSDRDMNATKSLIASVSDRGLKYALQLAFDHWQQNKQQAQAQGI